MKNTELENSIKELEELTKSEADKETEKEQVKEPTLEERVVETQSMMGRLAKSFSSFAGKLVKSQGAEKDLGSADVLTETLAKSEGYQTYQRHPDASTALTEFQGAVSEGFGSVDARLDAMEKSLAAMADGFAELANGFGVMLKSQAEVHKGFQTLPRTQPARGVTTVVTGVRDNEGEELAKSHGKKVTRGDIQVKLEELVNDDKISPNILSVFARNPNAALARVDEELRKSHGLPDSL